MVPSIGYWTGAYNITDSGKQTALTDNSATATVAAINRDLQVNANGDVVDSQGNSTAQHNISHRFLMQKKLHKKFKRR